MVSNIHGKVEQAMRSEMTNIDPTLGIAVCEYIHSLNHIQKWSQQTIQTYEDNYAVITISDEFDFERRILILWINNNFMDSSLIIDLWIPQLNQWLEEVETCQNMGKKFFFSLEILMRNPYIIRLLVISFYSFSSL